MESVSGRSPMARYWMHTGLLHVDGAKGWRPESGVKSACGGSGFGE
jgi:cysteinyl-tRNA synthetase